MNDFQKWSVLAFRAMDDAGRVLMTIEPESTTEGERLDQLKATIRELLTQCLLLNGLCTRRQLDERFGFGKLDTDALNVQLGLKQQAEPVQEPQLKRIHPLDIPLEVFVADLSTRPRNVINAEMMYFINFGDEFMKPPFTVRHLIMFSRKELRKWPNLGKRSLNEIEEMLRSRGLQLWDEHDERSLSLLREHPTYYTTPPAAQPEQKPVAPDDESICDDWISASDSDGIAYDGPSFECGYKIGRIAERDAQPEQEPVATMKMLHTYGHTTPPAAQPAYGDIRALKHRIHELEGEVIGYKRMIEEAALKKLADLGQQIEQEPVAWMPVTEALPKSGVKVLACYRNRLGNLRRILAMWTAAKTEEADGDAEACIEYDEAADTYYVTEGWYECIDNWDDYSSVAVTEGEVTHWMPLPQPPIEAHGIKEGT